MTQDPNSPQDPQADPEPPHLTAARGVYIGPIDRDDALATIREHTGTVIVQFPSRGFPGGATELVYGYLDEIANLGYDDQTDVFAIYHRHVPLGWAVVYTDAVVLDLSSLEWTAEQYTGGLDITSNPSTIVRLVFWQDVLHVTMDGDVAPSPGPFDADIS